MVETEIHIEIAYQNLISRQIISNDESRNQRIHDPMKHTDILFDDGTEIRIEVNRHHCLVYTRTSVKRSMLLYERSRSYMNPRLLSQLPGGSGPRFWHRRKQPCAQT